MMSDSKHSKHPVSIEDLLQLKRSERPPEEFWTRFEHELRAKQLAAIVERRPVLSWHGLREILATRTVSFGAVAAVGVALFSIHEFRNRPGSSDFSPAAARRAPVTADFTGPSRPAAAAAASLARASLRTAPPAEDRSADRQVFVLTRTRPEAASAASSFPDPFGGVIDASASLSAATLTEAAEVAPSWTRESVPQRAFQAEPLARTITPSDERRAVLLSDPLPRSPAEVEAASLSDEHPLNELSDDRLYQTVRRYGVGGDRLQIRF